MPSHFVYFIYFSSLCFILSYHFLLHSLSTRFPWGCNTIINIWFFLIWLNNRYIPSEKIGQFFWPPRNGFFGIDYHYWTWGNAFWPFLAPPDPWGGSEGVWGGQGGSWGPKIVTFLGATFGLQIGKFWIVWTENTLFSRFLAKWWDLGPMYFIKVFCKEFLFHLSEFCSKYYKIISFLQFQV